MFPPISLTEICMKLFELFMHMASTATPPLSAHTHTLESIAAVKTKRKRKTGKHTQRSRRRCQSYSYEKYLLRKPINCKKSSAADADSGRNALVKLRVWGRMRSKREIQIQIHSTCRQACKCVCVSECKWTYVSVCVCVHRVETYICCCWRFLKAIERILLLLLLLLLESGVL